MKSVHLLIIICMIIALSACNSGQKNEGNQESEPFKYLTEQFADAKILRYQVPGFEALSLNQKILVYYLSQAALAGRDITYDQNYKYNLVIRRTLEAIYSDYKGDRNSGDFQKFMVYLKEVWFNNGIHHHSSTEKIIPEFSRDFFTHMVMSIRPEAFPLKPSQDLNGFLGEIIPLIFFKDVASKRVSSDPSKDLVLNSSNNFYEGVSQAEVENFYSSMKSDDKKKKRDTLVAYGLNSKVVKENGQVIEKRYTIGGLYSPAIEKIVYWLGKATSVAENDDQKASIDKLIEYYRTGDLKTWDEYNILWVKDVNSLVDFVNGFIEVYGDPLAKKATWESVVNFKDIEATKRTGILSRNAQYFEDHSPVDPKFKKKEVRGITAKVITVAQLGGENDPTTPVGINLPNSQWIRKEYGSKSVTMDNITYSYDQVTQVSGMIEEFGYSQEEIGMVKKYGYLAGNLTTDLHECLGHGSGQLNQGITAESLKNYHSTIEEARADLFALYYIMDPMMTELKLIPSTDVAMAEYSSFIRNGLMTQLVRIQPGKNVAEAHMRDRALIAHWVYEKGKGNRIIEKVFVDKKTFFVVRNYQGLRDLFGQLLMEIQRITSEGDYNAAKALVETYGVQVDPELHKEVLERYKKLKIAPYSGFINPVFEPVMKGDTVADVKITYPEDFSEQMMYYSKNYSFLPSR